MRSTHLTVFVGVKADQPLQGHQWALAQHSRWQPNGAGSRATYIIHTATCVLMTEGALSSKT